MENLRDQIFQTTDNFLTTIRQLTQRHTELLFQETFSRLGSEQSAASAGKTRGAKRGSDELGQLSQRFAKFVRDNPGLRIEQINKTLGTTTAELALPIRKLVSSGAVSVKGKKRATSYFPGKNIDEPAAVGGDDDKKASGSAEAPPVQAAGKSSKKRSRSRSRGGRSRTKSRSKGS